MKPLLVAELNRFDLSRILDEPAFFRAVFDAVPHQIVVKSLRSETFGVFLIWNRAAEEALGIRAEEAIGKTDDDFFPSEQVEFFRQKDLEVMAAARPLEIECEEILSRRQGRRLLRTLKTPIYSRDGEPLALIAFSEDVTESLKTQRELLEAREIAERASHAKSAFLSTLSHEIRTRLNGIMGFTEMLLACDLGKEEREYAQAVHDCGGILTVGLEELLEYSTVESERFRLRPEVCDLSIGLATAAEVFRAEAEAKGAVLETIGFDELPRRAVCDLARLRQVLQNLIGNAVKFTGQNGRVEVRVRVERSSAEMADIEFVVRDNGVGIPAEALPRIWEPFFQTDYSVKQRKGGVGLGLPIAKKLIDRMGGTISASSQAGKGSEFQFRVSFELSPEPHGGEDPRPPLPDRELRVLIVEDNAVNRKVLRMMFGRLGIDPDEAENGRMGVEHARASPYDLIIMDIQMPVMDGIEATRRLRALPDGRRFHITACSAHVMPADRKRCSRAGMDDFIAKPVRLEDLRKLCEAVRSKDAKEGPAQEVKA